MRRRISTIAVLTAILMTVFSTAALAHQCMVANRSQTAEQAIGKSPMWLSENMATHESYVFTFAVVLGIPFDPDGDWVDAVLAVVTEDMLDDAVQAHLDQGLQEWAAFFQGHTLMTNPKTGEPTPAATKHSADGQGIDHWFDSELGQSMIAIAASIAADEGLIP